MFNKQQNIFICTPLNTDSLLYQIQVLHKCNMKPCPKFKTTHKSKLLILPVTHDFPFNHFQWLIAEKCQVSALTSHTLQKCHHWSLSKPSLPFTMQFLSPLKQDS